MKLKIAHLYPELLNLYGDGANVIVLKKRAQWRGIEVEVIEYKYDDKIDFSEIDILLIGGGSDKDQLMVCERLKEYKEELKNYVENNGVVLAISGGFQLLGEYYKTKTDTVEGLSVLDIYTEYSDDRIIGNVVIKTDFIDMPVVGFENHFGRTYLKDNTPLGNVVYGCGNNDDKTEGVVYKNVFGTYLHGPLLPKNPQLCDYIIKKALQNKYEDVVLQDLDDSVEIKANDYIVNHYHN